MRKPSERAWSSTDWGRASWFVLCHTVGVLAWTRYFSWRMLGIHFLLYCACGMGITYSFHRQLAHRAFKSPKWLEYCASCARPLEYCASSLFLGARSSARAPRRRARRRLLT